jgi:hypothetical protein
MWLLKISLILVDSLLKVGPGKTKKNPGKVLEKSWNFLTKKVYEPWTGLFPHDNFSSVYWIFNKLGHMIPLWKAKNPIYIGVIRSKVKVTVTINRIFDNRIVSLPPHDNFSSVYWIFTKLGHMIPLWKGKNPIYFGVITIIPFYICIDGRILWCTHFLL